jgi:hypothetical protein
VAFPIDTPSHELGRSQLDHLGFHVGHAATGRRRR